VTAALHKSSHMSDLSFIYMQGHGTCVVHYN